METEPVPAPSPETPPAGGVLTDPALANLPFRPARRYYVAENTAPDEVAATRYPTWIMVSTVALAVVLAHGLCVRSTFYLEDWTQVVSNEWVESGTWWQANLRTVTYFTHWLTYALTGFSSPAFHFGNLALHVAVSLLVAGFGRDLLTEAAGLPPERARRIGWWAGLLFAVHPLCSEVLNYVRWRDMELASLFALLAMRAAIRWRRQRRSSFRWPTATLLMVAAATFCKEIGFILAAGGAFLVWLRTPPRPEHEIRQGVAMPLTPSGPTTAVKTKLVATPKDASLVKGNWPVALSLGLVALCLAALAWPLWVTAAGALHHPRLGWHTLTRTRVFWMGMWRTVVPIRLCSDHMIPWTVGLDDVVAWVAAGTEALAVAGAGWLYFRRSVDRRTVGILLAVMFLDLLYRLANPNAELMVEARLYPAMGPICIGLAWGLDRLVRWRRDGKVARRPLLAAYALGTLLAVGIVLSVRRAQTWHDTQTLVVDVLTQYPLQARAYEELQAADVRAGYWTETLKDQVPIRATLEQTLAFNGRSEPRKFFPGSVLLLHIRSEGNYALALAKLGKRREAAEHLAWVQKSVPESGEVAAACQSEFLFARGLTKEAAKEEDGAVVDLTTSEKLTGNPEAHRELRRIWRSKQRKETAPEGW